MKRVSVVAIALTILIRVELSSAAELQARVQTVDATDRVVLLQDGTKLWLAEDVGVKLQEGVTVKLSYEERDGKQIVTSIETAE